MNKNIYFLIFLTHWCLIISGCGISFHSGGYETEKGYINENGISFLSIPKTSNQLASSNLIEAEAYRIRKEADAYSYHIKNTPPNNIYKIAVANLKNEIRYVFHPESGNDLLLEPSTGSTILILTSIPEKIYIKNSKKEIIDKATPDRKKMAEKKYYKGGYVDLIMYSTW